MKGLFTNMTLAIIFVSCQSQNQQQIREEPSPELENLIQQAAGLIGQGKADNAIAILDSLSNSSPENFRIWNTLGNAYNAKQDYTKSIAAYEKALVIAPTTGRTIMRMAFAQINNGDIDGAFKNMLVAKKSKIVNTTSIQGFPVYEKIKGDERISQLFPTKEEFADPFVEETKIIHEWIGEAVGDQFGWIARNIGDVNNDGVDDMVTSAPTNDEGGNNAGKIYVYSGSDGKLLWTALGIENGQLGMGVEYGGDINNDGIPDVVAGSPFVNKAFAYSGKDGSVIHTFEGDSTSGFGLHLSGVDDINDDGYGDVLIGEPYQVFNSPINGDSIPHPGKAHLYSGKNGEELKVWEGEESDDAFGTAVAGRVIDGNTYLMVGAPNAGLGNRGLTYIYKGIQEEASFLLKADSTGARFGGMFLSVVGDVNADGINDLYASDFSNNADGPGRGRAYRAPLKTTIQHVKEV